MGRIEKTVFLSYRRANISWALAIFHHIRHNGYDVFLDFKGIGAGDFERVILENIKARAHFLVLLTPTALNGCSNPSDWLRREIENALKEQRNIVPVMLDGFSFEAPETVSQLSGPLAALRHYNALRVYPEYFDAAMSELRDRFLNVALETVLHPVSPAVQKATKEDQLKAAAAAVPVIQEKISSAHKYFDLAQVAAGKNDDAQAVRWYQMAADAGHAGGMSNLGAMYAQGRGGLPQDDTKAVSWFRNAADAGDASGMTRLGYMCENGRGLPKDKKQAVSWYQKAIETDPTDNLAQEALQRLQQ